MNNEIHSGLERPMLSDDQLREISGPILREWPPGWLRLLADALVRADRARAPAPSGDERKLRRMLCVAYSGAMAYMDDGEAQDYSAMPSIDFMRDSPEAIQAAIVQRAVAHWTPRPAVGK